MAAPSSGHCPFQAQSPQPGVSKTMTLPFGSAKRRFPEDSRMISSGLGCHFDLLFTFKEASDGVSHLSWLPGRHPSPGSEDRVEC